MQAPTIELVLILSFIFIGMVFLYYKIYQQLIINNPEQKPAIFSAIFRIIHLVDFMPMSLKCRNEEQKLICKRANLALLLFYACILCAVGAAVIGDLLA
jgi:hypothetical protein